MRIRLIHLYVGMLIALIVGLLLLMIFAGESDVCSIEPVAKQCITENRTVAIREYRG